MEPYIENDAFYGECLVIGEINSDTGTPTRVRLVKSKKDASKVCIDIRKFKTSDNRYEKGIYMSIEDYLALSSGVFAEDLLCNIQPDANFDNLVSKFR